jgi:hypothetical protein
MKKIFYEKRGRRYYPVHEYNQELLDGFPKGNHLVMCYPGGQSRRFNIEPNYAAMIAAGRVAEDVISDVIRKATDIRPSRNPITEGQLKAWKKLAKEFGEEQHALQWPSAREAAEKAVEAMVKEAEKLLTVPAVKKAFDHFLFVAELTKETKND